MKGGIDAVIGHVDTPAHCRKIVFDGVSRSPGDGEDMLGLSRGARDKLLVKSAGDQLSPGAIGAVIFIEQPHNIVEGKDARDGQIGRQNIKWRVKKADSVKGTVLLEHARHDKTGAQGV